MARLPNVHFGAVKLPVDWRKQLQPDELDDDEQLTQTPPEVVEMLGFDPASDEPA